MTINETLNEIQHHLHTALKKYTSGHYYTNLIVAKKEYFSLTGQTHEHRCDFESRMQGFNDWYLFQHPSLENQITPIKDYLEQLSLDTIEDQVREVLQNINYSLFEYQGLNFRKHIILKDVIHRKKISLPKGHPVPGLIKNDLFIGRVLYSKHFSFLMPGKTVLPREIKPVLKKQAKQLKVSTNERNKYDFLVKTEFLNTKFQNYEHVPPKKIFVYY